jgi:hypothetical protein
LKNKKSLKDLKIKEMRFTYSCINLKNSEPSTPVHALTAREQRIHDLEEG